MWYDKKITEEEQELPWICDRKASTERKMDTFSAEL